MTTLFDELSQEELEEVRQRIGGMMLMLPVASGIAGHKAMTDTIKGNYLGFTGQETKVHRIAKEFVNDLFTLKTEAMCRKWYGDSTGASVRRKLRILAT